MLAWQLAAAGEQVLDIQPKLAARVRLLEAGDVNKNDPNDARSVAVAALRSRAQRQVAADGHAAVLKIWAKRHRDLARSRNQVACRLHAVLCELVPGGFAGEITAGVAARVLDQVTPAGAAAGAHHELATEFLADLRRLDAQRRECAKKLAAAVRACGTSLTGLFGVGPVIAGLVIGDVADVSRFPSRSHFAACNGTAPVEVSSGGRKVYRLSLRGNRRLNHAIHMAAITQIRHTHSDGRAYYDRKIAEGRPTKRRCGALKRRISDVIYARLRADARQAAAAASKDPGGQPGNDSDSSAAGSHPEHRLFGQATPGPDPSLRSAAELTSAMPPSGPPVKKTRRATWQRRQQRGFDLYASRRSEPGKWWRAYLAYLVRVTLDPAGCGPRVQNRQKVPTALSRRRCQLPVLPVSSGGAGEPPGPISALSAASSLSTSAADPASSSSCWMSSVSPPTSSSTPDWSSSSRAPAPAPHIGHLVLGPLQFRSRITALHAGREEKGSGGSRAKSSGRQGDGVPHGRECFVCGTGAEGNLCGEQPGSGQRLSPGWAVAGSWIRDK